MTTTAFFYDGQIRRYLLQIVRMFSNFSVKYSDGTLVRVPVIYGNPDRQVAHILNQNSENTVQSAPRIAVYMSDLELDSSRLADSSYVGKINIRERQWDPDENNGLGGYTSAQGTGYTVERLMPTPFRLTVKVDIWASSVDQKLQLLEQILMLFNPSLEIQTNDNYVDWTSLSVVDLNSLTLSSRSVPVGVGTEIDVSTLTLSTPIWISPPAKVKRLGIVTSIISSIFDMNNEDCVDGLGSAPELGSSPFVSDPASSLMTSAVNYDLEVYSAVISGEQRGVAKILGIEGQTHDWSTVINKFGGKYTAGLSRIYLKLLNGTSIVGTFSLNPLDSSMITINWDSDTYPSNTSISSNTRSSTTTFDAIIDPLKTSPYDPSLPTLAPGSRYLIVNDIGSGVRQSFVSDNKIQRIDTKELYINVVDHKIFVDGVEVGSRRVRVPDDANSGKYFIVLDNLAPVDSEITYELYTNSDGPNAWKNSNGSDFIANENDIIEWDGNNWHVVFDSKKSSNITIYQSNIFTNTQYVWNGTNWNKSFEGVYRSGEWRIEL